MFLFLICLLFGIPAKANSTEINTITQNNEKYGSPDDGAYLYCTNSEVAFEDNTYVFAFESSNDIQTVNYTGNVTFVSYSIDENNLFCEIFVSDNYATLTLTVNQDTSSEQMTSLYFAKSSEFTFASAVSLDSAKKMAGETLSYDFRNSDDVTNGIESSVGATSSQIPSVGDEIGKVYGQLSWTDEQGGTHALYGAKLQLLCKDNTFVITTTTNLQGEYCFDCSDVWNTLVSNGAFLYIYTEGESIKVNSLNGGTYCRDIDLSFIGKSSYEFSYTFSPLDSLDGEFGRALCVLQGGIYFSEYAKSLNNNIAIETCTIIYPHIEIGYRSFYDNQNTIYLNANKRSNRYPAGYAAWDVIGHEYAHHLQKEFEISTSPGGNHSLGENCIDRQYNQYNSDGSRKYSLAVAKERGLQLAWSEGWATYWSVVAQKTFPDETKTMATVGDVLFSANNGVIYDIDAYEKSKSFGAADEGAIARMLYKLSSETIDEYDSFLYI